MGYIAPIIKADGNKFDGHKPGDPGYEFSQIPNRLLSYVMREIPGNCGNRLKLMIFLMGCGEGFEIHEKTILNRTGMTQSSYSQARDWLDKNYFITYKEGCKEATIKVNFSYLWQEVKDYELEEMIEKQEESKEINEERKSVVIGNQIWTWDKYNYLAGSDYFRSQGIDESLLKSQLEEYLPRQRKSDILL